MNKKFVINKIDNSSIVRYNKDIDMNLHNILNNGIIQTAYQSYHNRSLIPREHIVNMIDDNSVHRNNETMILETITSHVLKQISIALTPLITKNLL